MDATRQRTPLSQLLADVAQTAGASTLTVPADWLQGRAIYGGLSAALCLQSVLSLGRTLPPLRSAQLAFMAPAGPGVGLAPSIVREGKSTVFAAADMTREEGGLASRALFCFGADRASRLTYDANPAPRVVDPEQAAPFLEAAGSQAGMPDFFQHFESRDVGGPAPFSSAEHPEFMAWMRHRDTAIDSVIVALAALADALPPAAMAAFDQPAPVSSITWQFDMLDTAPATRDGWWLCRSRAEYMADGYATQTMTLWNSDRRPVLIGRQHVAVFY